MLNNKFFLLSVALFAVSSSAWVVRILPDSSAITLAFWRMFLASVMVFAISYKNILSFVPNKKILLAGIFLGAHFALFFRSVQLTSIPEATLLGTTAPIFTEIYGFVFKKRSPVLMVLFGLFFAFFGAAVLVGQGSLNNTGNLGNMLAVLSSVAMAFVLIIGKNIRKNFGVFEYTRWLFFFASCTLFVFSLFANKEYGGQVLVLSDSPAAALSAHEFSVGETIAQGTVRGRVVKVDPAWGRIWVEAAGEQKFVANQTVVNAGGLYYKSFEPSKVRDVSVFSVSSQEFRWVFFLALVPTMVGHNIFYYLIKTLNTTTVAAVPLGEPIVSSFGAFFIFQETVGWGVLLGGLITLFGVFIIVKYGDQN